MSSEINVDDSLSALPEGIISHILSLMPTKFGVRTSILSKRWRYGWMFVTNLDFDDIHPVYREKVLEKFVDRVMGNCKSSQIQLFRLHFADKEVKRSSVSSWIDKAVRLNVCEIDIQDIIFDPPLSLFTCKTLTKLRIDHDLFTSLVWECPCPVDLPCLKTLDIAVSDNSFVNAFQLIHCCLVLESLSLEVRIWNKVQDCIFNIPTLKRLKLTLLRMLSSVTNKVVLNVPNLEYLIVGGMLVSRFVMEDVSSLVEASILFEMAPADHLSVKFLKVISGVKSLSYKRFPLFPSALPIFPNMEHLEFTCFMYSEQVLEFLEICPKLKHLCIEELIDEEFIEPKSVPLCMLSSLTTINFSKPEPEIGFLKYMLENAEVLKTVTITSEIDCIEKKKKLCADLLELPRASRNCEIRLLGNRCRST